MIFLKSDNHRTKSEVKNCDTQKDIELNYVSNVVSTFGFKKEVPHLSSIILSSFLIKNNTLKKMNINLTQFYWFSSTSPIKAPFFNYS